MISFMSMHLIQEMCLLVDKKGEIKTIFSPPPLSPHFYDIIHNNKQRQGIKMLKKELKIALAIALFATTNLIANSNYTMAQIYEKMCIECHSSNGSGNTDKLTPSMRDETLEDIKISLKEVEDDDGHVIMNHNREKIIEKGMEYSAKDMAQYMFDRFHK